MKKLGKLSALWIFVALATISVISCKDSPSSSGPDGSDGNAYYGLNIGGTGLGRTIKPDLTMSNFKSFKITFTPSGGDPDIIKNIPSSAVSAPIIIAPGTYDIKVIGYKEDNQADPIAEGSITGENIVAGANSGTAIYLNAYDPDSALATGNGIYSWNIVLASIDGLAGTGSTASMKIIDASSATLHNITLTTGSNPGSLSLSAGFYDVLFEIKTTGGALLELTQSLWIYQNLTSDFTYTFNNASFGPQKVTFNMNDNAINSAITANQIHTSYTNLGGYITTLNGPVVPYSREPTSNVLPETRAVYSIDGSYYALDGWFEDDGTGNPSGTAFSFGGSGTQILGEMNVVAKWEKLATYTPLINVNPAGGIPLELQFAINSGSPSGISYKGNAPCPGTTSDLVLSVSNASEYSSISWHLAASGSQGNVSLGSGQSINIINSNTMATHFVRDEYNTYEYLIEVTAIEDDTGYTQTFMFTLVISPKTP